MLVYQCICVEKPCSNLPFGICAKHFWTPGYSIFFYTNRGWLNHLYCERGFVIPTFLEDHPRTCKWLITSIYKPWKGHLEGEQPYLGDLLTMVINHLYTIWNDPPTRKKRRSHLAVLSTFRCCEAYPAEGAEGTLGGRS